MRQPRQVARPSRFAGDEGEVPSWHSGCLVHSIAPPSHSSDVAESSSASGHRAKALLVIRDCIVRTSPNSHVDHRIVVAHQLYTEYTAK